GVRRNAEVVCEKQAKAAVSRHVPREQDLRGHSIGPDAFVELEQTIMIRSQFRVLVKIDQPQVYVTINQCRSRTVTGSELFTRSILATAVFAHRTGFWLSRSAGIYRLCPTLRVRVRPREFLPFAISEM